MAEQMMIMPEPEERRQSSSEAQEATAREEYEEMLGEVHSIVRTSFEEQDLSSFDSLPFRNTQVYVRDFQLDFISFSLQQQIFERVGLDTPVVKVKAKHDDIWIPIDFGFQGLGRDAGKILQSPRLFRITGDKYNNVRGLVADTSGLSLGLMNRDEANSSFLRGIAGSILTRFFSSNQATDNDRPPPTTVVSVITDEQRQLVMYCKGYFFSTEQAFAYSNPASRAVNSGWYMFGLHTARGPRFMEVLFEVPPTTEVRLELP
jgi:hypothetical protein